MTYQVQVINYKTKEVVKTLDCDSLRRAFQAESGFNINLNHEEYFTSVIDLETMEEV